MTRITSEDARREPVVRTKEVPMKLLVLSFTLLLAAGLVPARELSRLPASPGLAEVGPISAPETDPQILAIRAQQQAALVRGDRAELKRLEGEVQAILLSLQPAPPPSDLDFKVALPGACPTTLMGPDAVIDTGRFSATGADYMMDGTMYVAAFRLNDTTNWIYRSTDHGSSWQKLIGYYYAPSGRRLLTKRLGLCVGQGDSAFLYMFLCLEEPLQDLRLIRTRLDGYGALQFIPRPGPDTTSDFAVCRDYSGSDYWLYAVAVNDQRVGTRNARYVRSTDFGKTWAVTDSGSFDLHPHYSFGAGSWLYHALEGPALAGKGEVWLFYNSAYGAHGQWNLVTVKPDTFGVGDPVIAPAFTLPESTASVWSVFSHNFNGTGDWDMLYASSTDGGRSWPEWGVLSGDSDTLERFADLRNYTSLGNTYINASYIWEGVGERKVYRRYAESSDPGNWSDTLRINQHSAGTGRELRPLLIYSPEGPGPGSGCVFVGAGLQNLYFNSPWLVGLADAGSTRLSSEPRSLVCRGVFEWPGSVPARLFNAAGRQVARVNPGTNDLRHLPVGVYSIVEAEDQGSRRIIVTR